MVQPDVMTSAEKAGQAAETLARRLNALTPELERGWTCTLAADNALIAKRSLRGYTETYVLDGQLFRSAEARKLNEMATELQATYLKPARSEEHTSELQSLMRISYAVFCLKKQRQIR